MILHSVFRAKYRTEFLFSCACALLAACSGGGGRNVNAGQPGAVIVTAQQNMSLPSESVTVTQEDCDAANTPGLVASATGGSTDVFACAISDGISGISIVNGNFVVTADVTLPKIVPARPSGSTARTGTSDSVVAYFVTAPVFVEDGASLTIEAGALLVFQDTTDGIFVRPGGRLVAQGTANAPIIFTSNEDWFDANANDGLALGSDTARGQWGGLVFSGRAPINDCNDTTITNPVVNQAGCVKTGEGGTGDFGGNDPAHDCGTLEYIRVQFAGFGITADDELNGIAFQGCGTKTRASYIQVYNNDDDGIEFFGGTMNASHVVVNGAGDDSIDWTDGWNGTLQYLLVVQNENEFDRAIEGDNRSNDTNITPVSNPTIEQFTLLGAGGSDGVKLRAGTGATLRNGIISGFADGVDVDDQGTARPTFASLYLGNNTNGFKDADGDSASIVSSDAGVNGVFPTSVVTGAVSPAGDAAFIGAFDPVNETAFQNWTSGWTITGSIPALTQDVACPAGTTDSGETVPSGRVESKICDITNPVLTDVTLEFGNLYRFTDAVPLFVGEDVGPDASNPDMTAAQVTLTIEPGVTVYAEEKGATPIVIRRGSRIQAAGNRFFPITLTAKADVFGIVLPKSRGEFGGLVINGRAPINDCNDTTIIDPMAAPEACVKTGEGGSGDFGGNDPLDDSGTLRYVRVSYAGFGVTSDDELNGIAFQGVGSATTVEYVQVHNNDDDGIEFFGGTVNAKRLVLTGNGDDSIDWTDGWTGKVQFAIIKHADDEADRGIEGDNRSNDTNIQPRSVPILANLTIVGSAETGDGIKLRAGTGGWLYNVVVTGTQGADAIDFDAQGEGTPAFFSSYIGGNRLESDTAFGTTTVTSDGLSTLFTSANGNVDGDANGHGFALTGGLLLAPGENVQAVTPSFPEDDSFFDAVSYIGAVADTDDDWFQGWVVKDSL